MQKLAKAGLWVLNSSSSKPNLRPNNVPISDQIKNHYNTMMFNNENGNFETTQDTDDFERAGSRNSNQSYSKNVETPNFQRTMDTRTPNFGTNLGVKQSRFSRKVNN